MKQKFLFLLFFIPLLSLSQAIPIKGNIVNDQGEPIAGVTITLKRTGKSTLSDAQGKFSFENTLYSDTIIISATGYEPQELMNTGTGPVTIILMPASTMLKEVTINTGYQQISPGKSTGSYTTLDNDLLNRLTSSDIITRLEHITPSLSVDKRNGRYDLAIRGLSTILA